MPKNNKLLKSSIEGNAVFSLLSGLSMIIWSTYLSEAFGIHISYILTAIGITLILFSVSLWIITRMNPILSYIAWIVIALDIAWLVGSIILIGLGYLTSEGNFWTGAVAFIILLISVRQIIGVNTYSRMAHQCD